MPGQIPVRAPDVDVRRRADRGASRLAGGHRRLSERLGHVPLRTSSARTGPPCCVPRRVRRFAPGAAPDIGRDVAIDASDLPAHANGMRYVSNGGELREQIRDPDASWGHRSAIRRAKAAASTDTRSTSRCTRTGLPLAWQTRTARHHESLFVAPLLDAVRARGFRPRRARWTRATTRTRLCRVRRTRLRSRHPDARARRGSKSCFRLRRRSVVPAHRATHRTVPRPLPRRAAVEREFGSSSVSTDSARSACGAWIASNFTPTSRCWHGSTRAQSRANYGSPPPSVGVMS